MRIKEITFLGFTLAVSGLALARGSAAAKEERDKADIQAKEVAAQFMKAMKAEDSQAVMKVVEVPFFWDGKKNIKDRQEMERNFARVFEEKDLTQIEYTIKAVHTFGKLPENLLNEKDKGLLKEVLDKDDRIVLVALKRDGLAIMVRFREGKAKVVGFRD